MGKKSVDYFVKEYSWTGLPEDKLRTIIEYAVYTVAKNIWMDNCFEILVDGLIALVLEDPKVVEVIQSALDGVEE